MSSIELRRRQAEKAEREQANEDLPNRLGSFRGTQPTESLTDPVPAAPAVDVPVGVTETVPAAATPQELREEAQRVAASLVELADAEYEAAIVALQTDNPTLYAIVADELLNMAPVEDVEDGDDDFTSADDVVADIQESDEEQKDV